jgi:hypothetical protein
MENLRRILKNAESELRQFDVSFPMLFGIYFNCLKRCAAKTESSRRFAVVVSLGIQEANYILNH